jgi:methionyl-tRNA formyltransferase
LRLVFAGTPPFAERILAALHAAQHDIALVLTQPDRPSGRGLKLTASAVAQAAVKRGMRVEKPASLKLPEAQALIRAVAPDIVVVAAYGLLLPPSVLGIPPQGCLNVHASLLPRWRGAAPVQRAILAGDEETGVCIMRMDEGLDTGPVLLQRSVPIERHETGGSLTDTLAAVGSHAIVQALRDLPHLMAISQDASAATYAPKVARAEARIDWRRSNAEIDRQVRAFDPVPGAETLFEGAALKIWASHPVPDSGIPGQVLRARNTDFVVACGRGALQIKALQRPGGKRLGVAEFLRGVHMDEGACLGEQPLASP